MTTRNIYMLSWLLLSTLLVACGSQHAGTTDETETGEKVALDIQLTSAQAHQILDIHVEIRTATSGPNDSAIFSLTVDNRDSIPSLQLLPGKYQINLSGTSHDTTWMASEKVTIETGKPLQISSMELAPTANLAVLILDGFAQIAKGFHCGVQGTSSWAIVDSTGMLSLDKIPTGTSYLHCLETFATQVDLVTPLAPGETRTGSPLIAANSDEPLTGVQIDTMITLVDSLRGKSQIFQTDKPVLIRVPTCVDNCTVATGKITVTKEPNTGIDLGLVMEGSTSVYHIVGGVWGVNAMALPDTDGDGRLQFVAIPGGTWSAGFDWFP
jgi:hypothetical protein